MAFTTSDTSLVVLLFSKRVLTRRQNRAEGGGCRELRLPTMVLEYGPDTVVRATFRAERFASTSVRRCGSCQKTVAGALYGEFCYRDLQICCLLTVWFDTPS